MIALEILSSREEIDSKITICLGGGAAEVWVVNPKLRTLVIYTSVFLKSVSAGLPPLSA